MPTRPTTPPVVFRLGPLHVFVTLLLCGSLLSAGCTPSSSGSAPLPDTTQTKSTVASTETDPREAPQTRAPSATDSSRPLAQQLSDAQVQARIKQALVRERRLRSFDFRPEVTEGHVTLHGDVNTHHQYERADRLVRNLEGVETLANEVTVEGNPVPDNAEAVSTASASPASEASTEHHTVQSGDTLWSIARQYDTSVERIRALNDISSLQPGQRIRVQ